MFTPIIGLEIHLQLKTKSKVFCRCSTSEAEPNTNVCPICLGYPGAMPNLNREAVVQSIRTGLILNCDISKKTNWDRKSYMYPDLFKGFQISQLDDPICKNGEVEVLIRDRRNYYSKDNYSKKIGIIQAHLEEDTAKSIHGDSETLLDGNKAGFPLIEVVSAPDMHTADEAVSYAKSIRNLVRWFDICDGNLEMGQMRFDASISIALEDFDPNKPFSEWKGIKHTPIVEIKNLNSFSNLQDSLDYEIKRQTEEYQKTGIEYTPGTKETRGWNDKTRATFVQRKKEEANEYRFIPEPDIPTLIITESDIEEVKQKLKTDPRLVKEKLLQIEGMSSQAVDLIAEDISLFNVYNNLIAGNELIAAKIANLITNDLSNEILTTEITEDWTRDLKVVLEKLKTNEISQNELKQILKDHKSGQNDWISLIPSNDSPAIDVKAILQKAMSENTGVVEQIKSGKDSAKMFFVGIVMRETKGKADANEVKDMIDGLL